jgi:SMI1 / KNR4 family (SUKH-1)
MTRSEIHRSFVSAFHQGMLPSPAASLDIQRVEQALSTVLPQAYITFMQMHGAVRTPSLLSLIVDGRHEQWDVMALSELAEVSEGTKSYWSAGMPEHLIGFAQDSMGNLFCFHRVPPAGPRPCDAEIWFFDHEFCSESRVANGFDEWLLSYLKLKRQVPE